MKKQELIHLHALMTEGMNYVEEAYREEFGSDEPFPEAYEEKVEDYESLSVRPTSIHKSKIDHKQAVFAAADAVTTFTEEYESLAAEHEESSSPQHEEDESASHSFEEVNNQLDNDD